MDTSGLRLYKVSQKVECPCCGEEVYANFQSMMKIHIILNVLMDANQH